MLPQSLTRLGWESIGRVGLDVDILDTSDPATQDGAHLPPLDLLRANEAASERLTEAPRLRLELHRRQHRRQPPAHTKVAVNVSCLRVV